MSDAQDPPESTLPGGGIAVGSVEACVAAMQAPLDPEAIERTFPTTQWSAVFRAVDGDPDDAAARGVRESAREALCRTYWTPLYSFVRRLGFGVQEAEDLTQEFFLKLFRNNLWSNAIPEKGRLRSYLCMGIRRLAQDERAKRGRRPESTEANPPEEVQEARLAEDFDRQWALQLLERTQQNLCAEFDQESDFHLASVLLQLVLQGVGTKTYAQIGEELGLTEDTVKVRMMRLRARWRERLRMEVSLTVSRPEDVDDELRHLIRVLRGA